MGILRMDPGGFAAGCFGSGLAESAASASLAAPGRVAASKPLEAARNCLRSTAKPLRIFVMRVSSANAAIELAPFTPRNYTLLGGANKQVNRSSKGIVAGCERKQDTAYPRRFAPEQPDTQGPG